MKYWMLGAVIAIMALAVNEEVTKRVQAQDWKPGGYVIFGSTGNTVMACHDHYPELPEIARRLGVPQWKSGTTSVLLRMCDGREYSLVELVRALLIRMDEVARVAGAFNCVVAGDVARDGTVVQTCVQMHDPKPIIAGDGR